MTIEVALPTEVDEVEIYRDNDTDSGYTYQKISSPTDKLNIVMQRGGGFVIKCKMKK